MNACEEQNKEKLFDKMIVPQQQEYYETVVDSIGSHTGTSNKTSGRSTPLKNRMVLLLLLASLGTIGLTYGRSFSKYHLGNHDMTAEVHSSAGKDKTERQLFNYGSQFDGYNCFNERWNHRTPMYAGDFMCSYKNSYIWGMSEKGDLIWKDLSTGEKYTYYKNKENRKGIYFWLSIDGKMKIKSRSGDTLWVRKLKHYNHRKIGYRKCLQDWPCPYLHLHGDGVNVLNAFVRGEWDELNIDNHYNF